MPQEKAFEGGEKPSCTREMVQSRAARRRILSGPFPTHRRKIRRRTDSLQHPKAKTKVLVQREKLLVILPSDGITRTGRPVAWSVSRTLGTPLCLPSSWKWLPNPELTCLKQTCTAMARERHSNAVAGTLSQNTM